jgi:hypothetical protein
MEKLDKSINKQLKSPHTGISFGVSSSAGGSLPAVFSGGDTVFSSVGDGYIYRQFTTDGNLVVADGTGTIKALIVGAGGGGGAGWSGAGGGGGECMISNDFDIDIGTHAITIGDGGIVNTTKGEDTTFVTSIATITAKGGGTSNYNVDTTLDLTGGSGAGGNASSSGAGGASIKVAFPSGITGTIYGNAGGIKNGTGNGVGSGGGGGGSAVGDEGDSGGGGDGGAGVTINIGNASYIWGGGGGGASYRKKGGNGGTGGGGGGYPQAGTYTGVAGIGGISAGSGSTAGANTGSGGGGGRTSGTGGSGIVIVRHSA